MSRELKHKWGMDLLATGETAAAVKEPLPAWSSHKAEIPVGKKCPVKQDTANLCLCLMYLTEMLLPCSSQ